MPPTPPQTRAQGLSTVPITNEIFPGDAGHASGPYGLGIRVPTIVVSPWTRGGWVNSQLFDHTSLVRFLEARFAHDHPDLIEAANHSAPIAAVAVTDKYRCRSTDVSLNPGETETLKWPLAPTEYWYDLVVTVAGDPDFHYEFAGHVGTGQDSISDPALGGLDCRE